MVIHKTASLVTVVCLIAVASLAEIILPEGFSTNTYWPSENYPYHEREQVIGMTLALNERLCAMSWGDTNAIPFPLVEEVASRTNNFVVYTNEVGDVIHNFFEIWVGTNGTVELPEIRSNLVNYAHYVQWETLVDAKALLKDYVIPAYVDPVALQWTNHLASSDIRYGRAAPYLTNGLVYLTPTKVIEYIGAPTNYFDSTPYYEIGVSSNGLRFMPKIFDLLIATGSDQCDPDWESYHATGETCAPFWTNTQAYSESYTGGYFTATVTNVTDGGSNSFVHLTDITPPWNIPAPYDNEPYSNITAYALSPAALAASYVHVAIMLATNYTQLALTNDYQANCTLDRPSYSVEFTNLYFIQEFTYALTSLLAYDIIPPPSWHCYTLGSLCLSTNQCYTNSCEIANTCATNTTQIPWVRFPDWIEDEWHTFYKGAWDQSWVPYCWNRTVANILNGCADPLGAHWDIEIDSGYSINGTSTTTNTPTNVIANLTGKVADLAVRNVCTNFSKEIEAYLQFTTNHLYNGEELYENQGWGLVAKTGDNTDALNVVLTNFFIGSLTESYSLSNDVYTLSTTNDVQCSPYEWVRTNVVDTGTVFGIHWADLPLEVTQVIQTVSTNNEVIWLGDAASGAFYTYNVEVEEWWGTGTNVFTNSYTDSMYPFRMVTNNTGAIGVYSNDLDTNWVGCVTNGTPKEYNYTDWAGTTDSGWPTNPPLSYYVTSPIFLPIVNCSMTLPYEFVFEHYYTSTLYPESYFEDRTNDFEGVQYNLTSDISSPSPESWFYDPEAWMLPEIDILTSSTGPYAVTNLTTNTVTIYPYSNDLAYAVLLWDPSYIDVEPYTTNSTYERTIITTNEAGHLITTTYTSSNNYCFTYLVADYATNYINDVAVPTNAVCYHSQVPEDHSLSVPVGEPVYGTNNLVNGRTYFNRASVENSYADPEILDEIVILWWNRSTNGFRWLTTTNELVMP